MRVAFPAVVVLLVAAACGGTVSSNGGGASSSSGGSSGSSSSSSGSSGGTCKDVTIKGTRACVPGTALANTRIEVQVDDTSGCLPCFHKIEKCIVSVSGDTITLSMAGRDCTPSGDRECPAICGIPSATCSIPALAPGKYTVLVSAEGPNTGRPPRELVVTASATDTSCSLTQPGMPVPELPPTKYPTSCATDADCRAATFGNVCQPCACPRNAIATAASESYEADYRALRSQCPGVEDGIACAACAPTKATCDTSSGLTGTCTLVPDQ